MLLTRETAALEVAEVGADAGAAWRGVGALIGVVDAVGAAAGGLAGYAACRDGATW